MKRILVVDDETSISEVLEEVLRGEGYEPFTARHGLEGLERLRQFPADLVLLDLMMPVMDGRTFLERLRSEGSKPEPAVLLMSAGRIPTELRKTVAGALAKPFDLDELLALVSKLLGGP